MAIFRRELRAGFVSLCIWCGVVCAMTMLTMFLYPSFSGQMEAVSSIFAMMGPFTAALGMDILPMGSAIGFYGIETGTMLSVGGTMFAAFVGIAMLSKEEGGHTAEFLLTQPIRRKRVVLEKLSALLVLLLAFNAVALLTGWLCFAVIGEPLPFGNFALFHLMQLFLHIEVGCICFGLSAFSRRTQVGLGLGIALLLYFLSLIANMVDSAHFLRYITPFGYAEASTIFTKGAVDDVLVTIGAGVTVLSIGIALVKYSRKDIAA